MAFALRLYGHLYRLRRMCAAVGVSVLAVMLAWHVIFGANGMLTYEQKRQEYKKLQQQIEALQTENQRLEQQVQSLRSDPKTIEREAREQLRYARPGEIIYTLPTIPVAAATDPTLSTQKRESTPKQ